MAVARRLQLFRSQRHSNQSTRVSFKSWMPPGHRPRPGTRSSLLEEPIQRATNHRGQVKSPVFVADVLRMKMENKQSCFHCAAFNPCTVTVGWCGGLDDMSSPHTCTQCVHSCERVKVWGEMGITKILGLLLVYNFNYDFLRTAFSSCFVSSFCYFMLSADYYFCILVTAFHILLSAFSYRTLDVCHISFSYLPSGIYISLLISAYCHQHSAF